MESEISGIATAVVGVVAFVGTLVSRWASTDPSSPWFVRFATVFDITQIVDSTRRLDD